MAVNSRDVKAVVRIQCFFMDFDLFVVMKGSRRNSLPMQQSIPQFMANMMVQNLSLYLTSFIS